MRNAAIFAAIVIVAYLAGRHLVPSSAIDTALTWVLGLFTSPERMAMLGL